MNVSIFASIPLAPRSWGITWDMDLDWHYTCRCESQVRSTELVESTSFITSSRPVCCLSCGVFTSSLMLPVAHRSWRTAKVKSSQGLVLLAKPLMDEGAGESHWGLSFPKGLINQWFQSLKYCELLLQITLNVETMQCRRLRFDPWVRKILCRRKWQPISVFLPGEIHGQRSLADYSPWGCKESNVTEQLTHTHTHSHRPCVEEKWKCR